ncbi:oxidoreductase [Virgibacillus profundi]|uniref:Oxidoreductase n=1 Tax=Virgibacillus profundi TaxID=2024555 RepID=A0A2A2IEA9_9BACI|nr:SDR family oxidoreductase [Virgibacillus profundi]PAV29594.1 oxidoreductase [Virgibacillus profundi]PXY53766.1 SDR family NAD(P)-dependent oxidoreductase [Virgibacillus profundi]
MQNKVANKNIIITGASSGIGERIAWHIAENGGVPIMLARSIDKLEKQQKLMEKELNAKSFAYKVNLQNSSEIDSVIEGILLKHEKIDGLINNAGTGMFAYVNDMAWPDVEGMFQLNVLALMRTTKLMLPHFLDNEEAHIINIASQAGKISTPKTAAYAATKHAVLGFTNALRLEIKQEKIHVTTVNLGPVRTNFFKEADPNGTYQKNVDRYMLDPDMVAAKIVQHLFTNKREINLPYWMELGSKLYHLFPQLMERLLKKQFDQK